MKRVAIVGHRGVGKTSFLARVAKYEDAEIFDLDREIEARTGRKISEIFTKDGEPAFRQIELNTFRALETETAASPKNVYLACGGGFPVNELNDSWIVWWLRRRSDEWGRIFADRPRLEMGVSPLEEYRNRKRAREPAFKARADETLWLDEGIDDLDPAERVFVRDEVQDLHAYITLFPAQCQISHLPWLKRRLAWGASFELRDDLLSEEEMVWVRAHVVATRLLVSHRDRARIESTQRLSAGLRIDWPAEWGASPREAAVISTHRRESSIEEALAVFSKSTALLKAALPVNNFAELFVGHRWQQADPTRRAFLPMSEDGRWAWYRLWSASPFAFIRDGEGSAADQPTLLEWVRKKLISRENAPFAAVLGDPVSHSRTPIEQREFFAARGQPVYAIRVARDDWETALPILREFGLQAAAVTAPLKALAFASSVPDEGASKLQSANTLARTDRGWRSTNTDLEGLKAALPDILEPVAVWGGGGTLEMLRAVFPQGTFYSARTGQPREGAAVVPRTLVWAAGREGLEQISFVEWRPELVIDLDYRDDAPARELALRWGARYVSGLAMFRAQAEAQRKFWEKT